MKVIRLRVTRPARPRLVRVIILRGERPGTARGTPGPVWATCHDGPTPPRAPRRGEHTSRLNRRDATERGPPATDGTKSRQGRAWPAPATRTAPHPSICSVGSPTPTRSLHRALWGTAAEFLRVPASNGLECLLVCEKVEDGPRDLTRGDCEFGRGVKVDSCRASAQRRRRELCGRSGADEGTGDGRALPTKPL